MIFCLNIISIKAETKTCNELLDKCAEIVVNQRSHINHQDEVIKYEEKKVHKINKESKKNKENYKKNNTLLLIWNVILTIGLLL